VSSASQLPPVPAIEGRRIAVLRGGVSAEREVSLTTGEQVMAALREAGAVAEALDTADLGFIHALRAGDFDAAFICLHGRFGEDGTVQGLLEIIGVPYVGSGVLASALAMDKHMSRVVLDGALAAGTPIRMPACEVLHRAATPNAAQLAAISARLGDKVVVKPACEGSAIGVTIVHEPAELADAVRVAFELDDRVLVEQFIAGVETTTGVLGNAEPFALPTIEIVPEHEFYDYESKYLPGMSRHVIPARVSEQALRRCDEIAVAVHGLLGCEGMSRSDMIVAPDGEVYLLEVNTIPGMTPTSLLPDAARSAGIAFPDLCALLVGYALEGAE
jgi:D-alanine-D-alanine ligase